MIILTKDGVQGLVEALEKSTHPKKKIRGKKGEEAPVEPEELSLLDEWWESYRTSGVKGAFTQKSKFVAKILGDPKKEYSQDDIPFIKLLKEFASESITDPTQTHKQQEELSKIFMTFQTICNKTFME
jgi:hypothetical protein